VIDEKHIEDLIKQIEQADKMMNDHMFMVRIGPIVGHFQIVTTRFMKSRRPLDWNTCIGIHSLFYRLDLLEI
jgi:hypothetical protein